MFFAPFATARRGALLLRLAFLWGVLPSCASGPPAKPSAGPPLHKTRAVAPVPDVSGELLASVEGTGVDPLIGRLLDYIAAELPPAFAEFATVEALKRRLLARGSWQGLDQAIDGTRPWRVAIADPRDHRSRPLGPVLLILPVRDGQQLIDIIVRVVNGSAETVKGNLTVIRANGKRQLQVVLDRGYAFIGSSEQLVAGAPRLLPKAPRVADARQVNLTLQIARIKARYGQELTHGLFLLRSMGGGGDKVMRLVGHVLSTRHAELRLALRPKQIALTLDAFAVDGGVLANYLMATDPGPLVGLNALPDEAPLFFARRQSETERRQELDLAFASLGKWLEQLGADPMFEVLRKRWRAHSEAMIDVLGVADSGAFWVTDRGTVSLGGVYQLKDLERGRKVVGKVFEGLAEDVTRVARRMIGRAKIRGLRVQTKYTRATKQIAGVAVDVFSVDIRWPKRMKALARALRMSEQQLRQVRLLLQRMLGEKWRFAVAHLQTSAGAFGAYCFGEDNEAQLAQMIESLRADKAPPSGTAKQLEAFVGRRPTISLLYLSIARLTRQVLASLSLYQAIPTEIERVVRAALPATGDLPVVAWAEKHKQRLRLELSVDSGVLASTVKALAVFFMYGQAP